jgi:hypothetical protein
MSTIIKNCVASHCGVDGFRIDDPDVSLENNSADYCGRYGFYINGSGAAGIRQTFKIPASISDIEIEELAVRVHQTRNEYQRAVVEKDGLGRWAKENGVSIAQLAVALAQFGVSLLSLL